LTVATCTDNLVTALALAAQGFSVFPCHGGGPKAKSPMPFIKWREASTTDPATIAAWWRKWPEAAIGLDLAKSGLLVIDADRHGEADGVEAFGALMVEHGFDPDSAPLVATPNAGNHHYFRQGKGKPHGNSEGNLPPGINVRGAGGYVIAPGTVMQDGRVYELWGDLAAAPEIPDWLSAILEARRGGNQGGNVSPPLAPAPASRDRIPDAEIEELLSYIDPDCGYHDWVAVLMAIHAETSGAGLHLADQWSARGKKYPGSKELSRKWASFRREGITGRTLAAIAEANGANLSEIAQKHRGVPHYDPVEAAAAARRLIEAHDGTLHDAETGEVVDDGARLQPGGDWSRPGGVLEDIADWIVATSPLPNRRLALAASIAFVATICSRHLASPTGSGLQLFTICTGQTGIGKDWPMKAIERLAMETGTQDLIQSGKVTTSLAIEATVAVRPVQIIIADEVGRRIFGKANHKRAGTYESAITDTLLELWSCNPVTVWRSTQRVDRSAVVIEAPAVSLFGVSTHRDFYSALGRSAIDNGLINRLLIIEADKRASIRDIDGDLARKPPEAIIDAVMALKSAAVGGNLVSGANAYTAPGGVQHREIPWASSDVATRWKEFRDEMLDLSDGSEEVAPYVSRAAEMVSRLATIWALSRFGQQAMVTGDALEWAISLVRESIQNAMNGTREHIVSSEFQEHVRRVERIVKDKKRVPLSVVARKMGGVVDNLYLDRIVRSLELAGVIGVQRSEKRTTLFWP
jgi:hypothetical protein